MSKLIDAPLLVSIISALAAVASAVCAALIYRGNVMARKVLVQPRIFVRGSTREARERLPDGPSGLARNQLDVGGLFVENIGKGPAVKGILYVIDHQGNKIPIRAPNQEYSFLRIPEGNVYHFPSYDSPQLEPHVTGQNRIRVQVEYYDINDNKYSLPSTEENVNLFP